jgi:hypothetical protein
MIGANETNLEGRKIRHKKTVSLAYVFNSLRVVVCFSKPLFLAGKGL